MPNNHLVLNLRRLFIVYAEIPSAKHQIAVLIKLPLTLHQTIFKLMRHGLHNRNKRVQVTQNDDNYVGQWKIVVNVQLGEKAGGDAGSFAGGVEWRASHL